MNQVETTAVNRSTSFSLLRYLSLTQSKD